MATKKKSSALARLVDSIEIKNSDGSSTMVPVSAEDNSTLNKIMASQMRNLIQKSIDKFGGMDHLTPKELKELTEAARNIAEFSGEVYKAGEELDAGGEKKVEPETDETLDFSKLTQSKSDKQSSEQKQSATNQEKEALGEQVGKT